MMPLLEIDRLDATTLVRVNREVLDWEAAKLIGDQLTRLVNDTRPRCLHLNLGNVRLLTAAMLGRFLDLERAVSGYGGRLVLCNIGFPLYQLFEVTGLTQCLDVQTELLHIGIGGETTDRAGRITLACSENRHFGMSS